MDTLLCPCFSLCSWEEQKGLDNENTARESPVPAASARLVNNSLGRPEAQLPGFPGPGDAFFLLGISQVAMYTRH